MGIIETIKMITREEEKMDFVKSLLADTDFDDQKIAALCKVEESEVKQIRQDLNII